MFGMPIVVQGIAVPLWMSGITALIAGFFVVRRVPLRAQGAAEALNHA
jgi:hypothetical protein